MGIWKIGGGGFRSGDDEEAGQEDNRLTGEVGYPVGMTVTREYDRVVDLVSFDVVEHTRPGGTVAVPGVLKIGNLRKGENGICVTLSTDQIN